ncbi:MAG: hypothetical protein ACP6KW_04720 [Candidatus Thorarchaeota archaeon]
MTLEDDGDDIIPPAPDTSQSPQVLCKCGTLLCIGIISSFGLVWAMYALGPVFQSMGIPLEMSFFVAALIWGIVIGYSIRGR